jgi:hypothetical protein
LSASNPSARVRPRLDRRNGDAQRRGPLAEAVARIDHQRRADDEHRIGVFQRREGASTRSRGTPSPKKRRRASARRRSARTQAPKGVEIGGLDIGVAVGRSERRGIRKRRVRAQQLLLDRLARAVNVPHARQRTRATFPCSSSTARAAAR